MSASIKNLKKFFADYTNTRFLRYGIPFLGLLVAGSFGLEKYTKLRYDFSSRSSVSSRELDALIKAKKSPDVAFEELHRDESTDDWINIRGPRPWEDSKDVQDAQRKFREEKVKGVKR